jgi:sugar phosphate isomerase/epimerase
VNGVPRLQLSTAPFYRVPLRDAMRIASAAGYRAVEVMVTNDPATQDSNLVREAAEANDIVVEAIHAPFLLITRRVWGTDPLGKIYRSVQLAEEVGAGIVVVHPPYRWQVRYRKWITEQLAEFSARTGVTVAVENMFPVKLPGDRGMSFHSAQEMEELDRNPYMVLDTSHAAVAGLDIVDVYRRYRDKLQHVHLSNNAGKGWDSHLPVYAENGVLDIGTFLREVASDGFPGSIALELDLRPWIKDEDAVTEVLVRNREFAEAALGLQPAGR